MLLEITIYGKEKETSEGRKFNSWFTYDTKNGKPMSVRFSKDCENQPMKIDCYKLECNGKVVESRKDENDEWVALDNPYLKVTEILKKEKVESSHTDTTSNYFQAKLPFGE